MLTNPVYSTRVGKPETPNAVVDMDIKSFESAWTAEKWTEVIDDTDFTLAVVSVFGVPVGFVVLREQPDSTCAEIVKIAVKPAARRRGASYHLLVAAVDFTRRRGCFSLSITVPESLVYPVKGEPSVCSLWLKAMEFKPDRVPIVKNHFVAYGNTEDGLRFSTPIVR
jgi:GNAT superfamily N-acetyltransferase